MPDDLPVDDAGDGRRQGGPRQGGTQVQLLGINANWKSTQIDDVLNYTRAARDAGRWQFATGSASQLERVWKAYGVDEKALVTKADNEIDHVAALYMIDPQGRRACAVHDLSVIRVDPAVRAADRPGRLEAAAQAPGGRRRTTPTPGARRRRRPRRSTLPKLGGGTVPLGPGRPHLYLFFATWDTADVAASRPTSSELNGMTRQARATGLPELTAIDEGSVEPSAQALPSFISTLPRGCPTRSRSTKPVRSPMVTRSRASHGSC